MEKCREIVVPEYGTFMVPSNVYRIDCIKKGRYGSQHRWKSWGVRIKGHYRFFSDEEYKGCANAFTAAVEYRNKILEEYGKLPKKRGDIKVNKTKGVSLLKLYRKDMDKYVFLVQVNLPKGRRKKKMIYVGTEDTVTPERVKEAMRKGWELRKQYLEENHIPYQ